MVPSGIITKQIGDKTYVLVGLKSNGEEKSVTPGAPHWLRFAAECPVIETVPEGYRVSAGVSLPL